MMENWTCHLLNARGQLGEQSDRLRELVRKAEAAAEKAGIRTAFDVVVRASAEAQPPALLVSGGCYVPGIVEISVDTQSGASQAEIDRAFLKTVYHELHHILRWDGPGYGDTLGEAIVSEGLAQCFLHEMMDCSAEPWETAVPPEELAPLAKRAIAEFETTAYDHAEWFFGSGALPNWAGYSLGFRIISQHLENNSDVTALALARAPASDFRVSLHALAK